MSAIFKQNQNFSFSAWFIMLKKIRERLCCNSIYVRFTVQYLSKWKMYFHCNFIKNNFDAKLLFADTDSLIYEIKSENVVRSFLSGKICSTLVIIQKIQIFLMRLIKKLLVK